MDVLKRIAIRCASKLEALPAADAGPEIDVQQVRQPKDKIGFTGIVTDIDDRLQAALMLEQAIEHMDCLGYITQNGFSEKADTIGRNETDK